MSNSNIDSNLVGKLGTETITNFATIGDTSTALVGASLASSGAVSGTTGTFSGAVTSGDTYVKVGTKKYIIFGELGVAASIGAAASDISASHKGSVYIGPDGIWFYKDEKTASLISIS